MRLLEAVIDYLIIVILTRGVMIRVQGFGFQSLIVMLFSCGPNSTRLENHIKILLVPFALLEDTDVTLSKFILIDFIVW